jgi:tRNA A37 threonylcarbamoyladenosine dehydratase
MPANSSDSAPEAGGARAAESAEDRHHRTELFFGESGFGRIRIAQALVIGLGGVGGHAAVNLARSGIGALHLVDFDEVTESSLNRSAYALPGDVGRPKTEVLSEYLAAACPGLRVSHTTARCDAAGVVDLIQPGGNESWSVVIDAIDSVRDKIDLLEACRIHRVPVFASMGAAAKNDISLVQTGTLAETRVCPLAKQVRFGLRNRKVPLDIPCVWSTAKVRPDLGRPLPSQMSLPGMFGYALASLALDFLVRKENR